MKRKFIGPGNINYLTLGREYTIHAFRSTAQDYCVYNDIQKENFYPCEWFERVKPKKERNAFEFIGTLTYGEVYGMTNGKIYYVDFHQSSATKYSLRNDKKRRILVPKFYFRAANDPASKMVKVAHAFVAASIAKADNSSHLNNDQWNVFDVRRVYTEHGSIIYSREYSFNLKWIRRNSALFVENVFDMHRENPDDLWQMTVDNSREGYITFITKRK